jgi:hypothetical protein
MHPAISQGVSFCLLNRAFGPGELIQDFCQNKIMPCSMNSKHIALSQLAKSIGDNQKDYGRWRINVYFKTILTHTSVTIPVA